MTTSMYGITYHCYNCGWRGTKRFEIGKTAPSKAICTLCGCFTAEKSVALPYVPKPRPRDPAPDDWPPRPPFGPHPEPWKPWRDNRRSWDPLGPIIPYCRVDNGEERCGPRRWQDVLREPMTRTFKAHGC